MKKKSCAFPGCAGPSRRRGLCNGHYWQSWTGRELTPIKQRPDVRAWLAERVNYEGDECLAWPFGRSKKGYAKIKNGWAYRVMCEMAHGPAPFPKAEAAHSCGRGKDGCVNPRHLRWATHIENEADKALHGTLLRGEQHAFAKLTEGKVRAIREFAHTCSNTTIANLFGVDRKTIYSVVMGLSWRHVQ